MLNVQIINKSKHPLPAYATELSAGMDIRANLNEPISLAPMQRCLVPTGLYIALPEGFEAQVRPRSGLAIKKGITVLNSPGTIDADYRGEVCIIRQPFCRNLRHRRWGEDCTNGDIASRTSSLAGSGSAG